MTSALSVWLQFVACAGAIAVAGAKLSRYGDVISDKTGLSGSWIGLVLMAGVTSLPELVTGISSVTLADAPNIAVGDVLGSCVFNLVVLAVVDFLYREEPVYRRASQGHILSAGFGVITIGFAALNLVLASRLALPTLGHVGVYSPLILLLYFLSVRTVFQYEKQTLKVHSRAEATRYPGVALRQVAVRYAAAALTIVIAGAWLPIVGRQLATTMGWHTTFVGTLFVAGATSLPELAVTVASLRIGALDMAIANLLGSNLFNVAILAVDDAFFVQGPLLSRVSSLHAISAVCAMVMTALVVVALLYRPRGRVLRSVGWTSLGLFLLYVLNAYVLYLHGE